MKSLKKTNIILSPTELDNLTNGVYQYKCVNDSLLEPKLIPFWNWLTTFLPRWIHPNTLTILGSLSIIPSFLLFAYFSWEFLENVSGWLIAVGIGGVLLFQTLDNLDGRQARRLGLSSPIGDWFDHSLDILSMYVLISQVATVAYIGHSNYPILAVFGQMSPAVTHYFTFWDRSVTRELYLGPVSITEGQYVICAVLLGGLLGHEFWEQILFSDVRYCDLLAVAAAFVFTVSTPVTIILRVANHKERRFSFSQAIFQTLDLVVAYSGCLIWTFYSPSTVTNTRLVMMCFGMCLTNVATCVLLYSITLGKHRGIYFCFFSWLGAIHALLDFPLLSDENAIIVIFALSLGSQLFLLYGTLRDMRGYFQFRLFHVPKDKQKESD
mmetsp:Transcript_22031/g.30301  ORF Transcript_22031/g.30301 Transcript_22031/m.30301 type:complete len:381 (-) Transcript_22031:101-1243(-)|eukprot:CAMPEP_0201490154 /NCGR_PEP_ID=MMETSP0151_2-20130828/25285_1 /ASSEMBLY_ACC=CAM_ASM_000257 /TAXON_ID=200890 /ORGANISM="Paramoeba atlantica, Strain 621/1 / CCAP 1560/9" /LENGTH=380 /DNA_ID=CAMNT_0047875997 /DNA_START=55 /DNA_END=1197 /DNA_ORIENTATION=+